MSEKQITIDPITRLEGHGKIEIFLNDSGRPKHAVLQVPELRGFEGFCQGRRGEEMPRITERICGVCPEAHHLASNKALDVAYSTEPPDTAQTLRKLMYNCYIFSDHLLHLFYLGGPDLLIEEGKRSERNVLGVIDSLGKDFGKQLFRARRLAQEAIEIIGGHQVHPITGVPGGVSKGIDPEEKESLISIAKNSLDFAKVALNLFQRRVLSTERFASLLDNPKFNQKTYYMGLTDDGAVSFYHGDLRVIAPSGEEVTHTSTNNAGKLLEERVEPWTYVKFPYLKEPGWSGFCTGEDSGVVRVGPLARLNVAKRMETELAQREYKRYLNRFSGRPVHQTYAYHWARLIELLQAAERMNQLAESESLTGDELISPLGEPGNGTGVIEAARGTLIHDYLLDKEGLVEGANMIVPTTINSAAISIAIIRSAREAIDNGEVSEELLNRVEMSFRSYDPCLACATHDLFEGDNFTLKVYDENGQIIEKV